MTNFKIVFLLQLLFFTGFLSSYSQEQPTNIEVKKIYTDNNYNAFTSLIKYKDTFYCSFRSAEKHDFGRDVVIKIIKSNDGETWDSLTTISKKGYDLRDPKLSITGKGKIMLLVGGHVYEKDRFKESCSFVAFFNKKTHSFSSLQKVKVGKNVFSEYNWLWQVSWHNKRGYGFIYDASSSHRNNNDTASIYLVKTRKGIKYKLIKELKFKGYPNEVATVIDAKGEMFAAIRRETCNKKAYFGKSSKPYKKWKFIEMPYRIGGPNIIRFNKKFIVAARIDHKYTGIFTISDNDTFSKPIKLPSNYDSSYPGLFIDKNILYVSYYSSHEGSKPSIYFAKIPLSILR